MRIMARAAKEVSAGSEGGREWRTEEDDELPEDEERDGDVGAAVGNRHEESLEILCLRTGLDEDGCAKASTHNEDGVGCDESDLWKVL